MFPSPSWEISIWLVVPSNSKSTNHWDCGAIIVCHILLYKIQLIDLELKNVLKSSIFDTGRFLCSANNDVIRKVSLSSPYMQLLVITPSTPVMWSLFPPKIKVHPLQASFHLAEVD